MWRSQVEAERVERFRNVMGLDEVGRGCLAGPVYAACASLDYQALARLDDHERKLIRDSKTLSASQRERALPIIHSVLKQSGIGVANVSEIETLGILGATYAAMHRALQSCLEPTEFLLIDGKHPLPNYNGLQEPIIDGDSHCFAIAAASILAKQARDAYMHKQAKQFPHYGFDRHVGYGTKHHLEQIRLHGICRLHRRNFAPIRRVYEKHLQESPPC